MTALTITGRHPASTPTAARRSLLPFFGAMVLANAFLHLAIALTGNHIGIASELMLAVIALGFALYLILARRGLSRLRFGMLVAHMSTYAVVNVGFLLHASVLLALGSPAIAGDGSVPLDPGWIGATFVMASLWGLGLLMHIAGSLAGRGYEAPTA